MDLKEFKNDMMKFKISIESKDGDDISCGIEGTKWGIMNGLANLTKGLRTRSNLTEKDIRYAVDLGLKDDEEVKKEAAESKERIRETLEDFEKTLKEIFLD